MYLKRNKNMLKKSAAVVTASVMVMASAAPVMAEGEVSFREKMKEELATSCETLAQKWDADLAEAEEQGDANGNAKVNMTLSLDEAGQSMVGMLAGMDASWMKNISLDMNATLADGSEVVKADVMLNDTKICTMNVLVDFAEGVEYVQLPEISEAWIKASLNASVNGEAVSADSLETISDLASNPTVLLPEGKDFANLVERYGHIVFDHMQDGPSVEENVSVEGIGEDCTLLEGQMYEEDADAMAKEFFTTAQSDEQIAALLTKWSETIPDAGDLNAQFQSFLEETLAELDADNGEAAEEESAEPEYVATRIWVNGDGKIVGTEVALCTGIDADTTFTLKQPEAGDTSALLLDVQSEGSGFTVTGSSQKADGMSKGSYSVAIDGITMMELATESDIAASEEGYPKATCTVTFPQGDTEDNYNPLSMFSLVLNVDSQKEDNSVNLGAALLSSGAQLGALNMSTIQTDEKLEIPEIGTAYDSMIEEEANAYAESANYDTIIENIKNAGVPAELVDQIVQSMEAPEVVETEVPADAA